MRKEEFFLEGKNLKKEFIANDNGEFEIELPEGSYKISAKIDGFYQSKSRKLRVKSNQSAKLDFTLIGIRNDSEHP